MLGGESTIKIEILKYALCIIFSGAAVYQDFKWYKIKNKLCLTFMVLGLVLNFMFLGIDGMIDSVIGLLIPLILFPLFAVKMLGAGDIKAFCAIGAIIGKSNIWYAMAYSIISGGVIAVLFIIIRKNAKERLNSLYTYFWTSIGMRKLLTYGGDKNDGSKFRFSYGIMLGSIIMFFANVI